MSKSNSLFALLGTLIFGSSVIGQECCPSYVVYQSPTCCVHYEFVEYSSDVFVPPLTWTASPVIYDQFVAVGRGVRGRLARPSAASPVIYDQFVAVGRGVRGRLARPGAASPVTYDQFVADPIVYEEQIASNGCGPASVATPFYYQEPITSDAGATHIVGRAIYEDGVEGAGLIEGDLAIPQEAVMPQEEATPQEEIVQPDGLNNDVVTQEEVDFDLTADDDNVVDGDPQDGDSVGDNDGNNDSSDQ